MKAWEIEENLLGRHRTWPAELGKLCDETEAGRWGQVAVSREVGEG